MNRTQASPTLIPPPPRPPVACGTAAGDESPRRSYGSDILGVASPPNNFISDVVAELKRMAWPSTTDICAAATVTAGFLAALTAFLCAANILADVSLRLLNVYPR